ncbi:MAG: hypothetical protein V1831_00645 [Candidatus Woesearchaeota archaeon]
MLKKKHAEFFTIKVIMGLVLAIVMGLLFFLMVRNSIRVNI